MTIAQALADGSQLLRNHSLSPELDAEVLLAHLLRTDRTGLYRQSQNQMAAEITEGWQKLLALRAAGWPIAYLLGQQEFFGRQFAVDPRVLVPRPATETLVETVVKNWADDDITIADIGTGSGNIAISLASSLPRARLYASDISPTALAIATGNAVAHGLGNRILWRSGSLLTPWSDDQVDVVVANLPYLPTKDLAEPSIRREPILALHGGTTGLDPLRQFVNQLAERNDIEGVVLECLPAQIQTITSWLTQLPRPFMVEELRVGQSPIGLIGRRATTD